MILVIVAACVLIGMYGVNMYKQRSGTPTADVGIAPPQTTVPPTMITVSVTPSVTNAAGFRYSYAVEAVEFAPEADKYIGFRYCMPKDSVCSVYGIQMADIAKVMLGQTYTLSFDNYGNCTAAAGTSYCYVVGKHELK